uniref:cytosolic acyl coenzyme A thioester hydrolase isoform X1 n=2 Tax=Myxine glutinosa TaxID=7769 RepID=UPI00358E592D
MFTQVRLLRHKLHTMSLHMSRIMRPDDANVAGRVHGGTALRMIEEAGVIASTRHCNSQPGHENCVSALVRVERTDFLSPMLIGEVAHVSASVTYTAHHSLEVQAVVTAENLLNGNKRLTNKASLWYVPLSVKSPDKVLPVPPMPYGCKEEEEEGRIRYETQKHDRSQQQQCPSFIFSPTTDPEMHTVACSQSSLIHLVGPSDCAIHGFVQGGVTMKLMDEVAGIVAVRHCKSNVVTACVDAMNFHRKLKLAVFQEQELGPSGMAQAPRHTPGTPTQSDEVHLPIPSVVELAGTLLSVTGRLTFTSQRSMEVEVAVEADTLVDRVIGNGSTMVAENTEGSQRFCAVSAYFTLISLSSDGKPKPVPQLKLETEDEKKRFEEGKARYLQSKAKREAQKGSA